MYVIVQKTGFCEYFLCDLPRAENPTGGYTTRKALALRLPLWRASKLVKRLNRPNQPIPLTYRQEG